MPNRIVDVLSETALLVGTADDLAARLDLGTDELLRTLRALVRQGTVAVQAQPGGYLSVRLERRTGAALRAKHDRRRVPTNEWRP